MKKVFDFLYYRCRDIILYSTLVLFLIIGVAKSSLLKDIYFFAVICNLCKILCALVLSVFCLIDFFKGKFKITPFLIISVICALGVLIFSHKANFCFLVAFLYVFKDYDFGKILKIGSLTLLFSLIMIISLMLMGVINNLTHYRNGNMRMALGFISPVISSVYFLCFCLAYNYYRKEKITFIELLLEGVANCILFYFTNTRAPMILVFILITGSVLLKLFNVCKFKKSLFVSKINNFFNHRGINNVLKILFISLPVIILLSFTILVVLYGNQNALALKLNDILSGRLELTYNALLKHNITIFGSTAEWSYFGVDFAYFNCLFTNGIIGLCFVLFILIFICYRAFHEKKFYLCFILTLLIFYSFIDSMIFNVSYNLFLLALIDGQTGRKMMFGRETKKVITNEISQQISNDEKIALQQIKLSIIIPVYNGEKFIKACIDKVLQIDLNKEIIVINDCSTDDSLTLLQAYGDQIILIDLKKNQGVSHARNVGLEKASGDYVTFIDIDDDFELEMHPKMISKMLQENADICMCNNDVIETDGKVFKSKFAVDFGELSETEVISYYLRDKIMPAVWVLVFSAPLAKSVQFEERLSVGEDILYLLQIFLKFPKNCFVNETLYHYVQHSSSAMHTISNKLLEDLKVPDYLTDAEKEILNHQFSEEFTYFKLEMMQRSVHAVSLVAKRNKKQAKNMLNSILTKNVCQEIIKNKNTPRYAKIEFLILKTFGVGFHLFIFPFYALIRKVLRG